MINTIETDEIWSRPELLSDLRRLVTLTDIRFAGKRLPPDGFACLGHDAPCGYGPAQRHARRKIEKALVYLLQHLDKTVPVSTLSALVGISASNFYYLFKLGTGYTPIDFHIRARMGRACALLQETDLSVKEIASLLGYDDQFYFSRLFKSVNDLPPRAYRVKMVECESSEVHAVLNGSRLSQVPGFAGGC